MFLLLQLLFHSHLPDSFSSFSLSISLICFCHFATTPDGVFLCVYYQVSVLLLLFFFPPTINIIYSPFITAISLCSVWVWFFVIHLFLLSVFSFQRIEEFRKSYDKAIADLENLHRLLLDNRTVRASESEPALKSCRQLNQDVQKSLLLVMDGGECGEKLALFFLFSLSSGCAIFWK